MINDAARIHADRRLYMTATPRSFAAPDLAESASTARRQPRPVTESAADATANSMDNEAVYGKRSSSTHSRKPSPTASPRTTAS